MPNKTRFVFFGSPDFAARILDALCNKGRVPFALVTNPDRPTGRKKIISPPPAKRLVTDKKLDIAILQPERVRDIEAELKAMDPDWFIIAAYAHILPKTILDIPRFGSIGVHPSLLPQFRGPSPIQSAILNGATRTGVTLYKLTEGIDDGPMLYQKEAENINMGTCTAPELADHLAALAGKMLGELFEALEAGAVAEMPQNEAGATYTKKFKTGDAFIDPGVLARAEAGDAAKAELVLRMIRAFAPEPGAWTVRSGKRTKLLRARIEGNALRLIEVHIEGKKPIRIA